MEHVAEVEKQKSNLEKTEEHEFGCKEAVDTALNRARCARKVTQVSAFFSHCH